MPLSIEELTIRQAVLEDRQKRTDEVGLNVIRQLEVIQKDLTLLRTEQRDQIDRVHDRISAEKKLAHDDIWDAFHRHEDASAKAYMDLLAKMDAGRLWVMGALAAAVVSLIGVILNALFSASHAASSISGVPHP